MGGEIRFYFFSAGAVKNAQRGCGTRRRTAVGTKSHYFGEGEILDVNTKHAEERENAFEYSCKAREDDTFFTRRPDLDSLGVV